MRPDNLACIQIQAGSHTGEQLGRIPLRRKVIRMPASNLLSDKVVRPTLKSAKATTKPATLSDGGGLSLICQRGGGGWWRLRY